MNRSGICGCCDGTEPETPGAIDNRPGLSQVAYRAGTWAQFRTSMLDALSTAPALTRLKTRGDDDFTIALIDSFAVVCDILTFYSERSANEHYLRTATDIVSMSELAKLVGYKPAPGVAASTKLAITIQAPPPSLPGPPGRMPAAQLVPSIIPVPAGLQAQSIPDPGEQPVTFETVAPIEARWGWNALRLRTTRPLAADAANAAPNHVCLKGLAGSIAVGDWLLFLVSQGSSALNRVSAVTIDTTTQTTLVQFEGSGPDPVRAAEPSAAPPALSGLLGDAVIGSAIKGHAWPDQMQLVANATKLQWDVAQLEENISNFNAAPPASPAVRVLRLDVRAAMFGHNAPLYRSLPDYKALGGTPIGPVLPDWDSKPGSTIGDDNGPATVSLDQTYPSLVVGGWVVVLPSGGQPMVMRIGAARVLSRAKFLLSAQVTRLTLQGDAASLATLGTLEIRTTTLLGSTSEFTVAEEPVPNSRRPA